MVCLALCWLFLAGGLRAGEVGLSDLTFINAAAARPPIIVKEGIHQDPVARPNRVARLHRSLVTGNLRVVEIGGPIARLCQLWLGLCVRVKFPKQTNTSNEQKHQHSNGAA